jgi:hypothetical protein
MYAAVIAQKRRAIEDNNARLKMLALQKVLTKKKREIEDEERSKFSAGGVDQQALKLLTLTRLTDYMLSTKPALQNDHRALYDQIAEVINTEGYTQTLVDGKYLTISEITTVKSAFRSYDNWMQLSIEQKKSVAHLLYGVTDAGIGAVIDEQLKQSWAFRGLTLASTLSVFALMAAVSGVGIWSIVISMLIRSQGTTLARLMLDYTCSFMQIDSNEWRNSPFTRFKEYVTTHERFTDENMKGFGPWIKRVLMPGAVLIPLVCLALFAPILIFAFAPLIRTTAATLATEHVMPFWSSHIRPLLLPAVNKLIVKGGELSWYIGKNAVKYGASSLFDGAMTFFGTFPLSAQVVGLAVLSLGAFVGATSLVASAPILLALASGTLFKTLAFTAAGAISNGALYSAGTQDYVFQLVWTLVQQISLTAGMTYVFARISSYQYLSLHYLRNGFTRYMRNRAAQNKQGLVERKVLSLISRYGRILDALVYLAINSSLALSASKLSTNALLSRVSEVKEITKNISTSMTAQV